MQALQLKFATSKSSFSWSWLFNARVLDTIEPQFETQVTVTSDRAENNSSLVKCSVILHWLRAASFVGILMLCADLLKRRSITLTVLRSSHSIVHPATCITNTMIIALRLSYNRSCVFGEVRFQNSCVLLQGAELSQGENYSEVQVSGKYVMSECIVR